MQQIRNVLSVSLLLALFLLALPCSTANAKGDSGKILSELNKVGPKGFFDAHPWSLESKFWDEIYDCVSAGKKACLSIAQQILPVSDAAAGEALAISLGDALKVNPLAVREVYEKAGQGDRFTSACDATVPNDEEYSAKEVKELQLRLKAVKNVKTKNEQFTACADAIAERIKVVNGFKKKPVSKK